jgi:FixJ family two-component response regulator
MEDVVGQFMGMGVVGFLQKPFTRVTLLDEVRKALDLQAA